jgi:hypothetical protein
MVKCFFFLFGCDLLFYACLRESWNVKEMLIRSINNWLKKIKFNFIDLKKLKLRD